MTKQIYSFSEGNMTMRDLLGGKGANLAEMTHLGLPVPPGFTITTAACHEYQQTGKLSDALLAELNQALMALSNRPKNGSAAPHTRCWSRSGLGPPFQCPV